MISYAYDPNGSACTEDDKCASLQCYLIPFLGGVCGECNEDIDCIGGGCTPHSPFDSEGSTCNFGELDDACMLGLECANVFSLLGAIQLNTCSECLSDGQCGDGQICAPTFTFQEYAGARTCVPPNSLPQDAYCELENNGDLACASGRCSAIDIMGLAQIGACGECLSDNDCGEGSCVAGLLNLDDGMLTGSWCDGP